MNFIDRISFKTDLTLSNILEWLLHFGMRERFNWKKIIFRSEIYFISSDLSYSFLSTKIVIKELIMFSKTSFRSLRMIFLFYVYYTMPCGGWSVKVMCLHQVKQQINEKKAVIWKAIGVTVRNVYMFIYESNSCFLIWITSLF